MVSRTLHVFEDIALFGLCDARFQPSDNIREAWIFPDWKGKAGLPFSWLLQSGCLRSVQAVLSSLHGSLSLDRSWHHTARTERCLQRREESETPSMTIFFMVSRPSISGRGICQPLPPGYRPPYSPCDDGHAGPICHAWRPMQATYPANLGRNPGDPTRE